MGTSTISKKTKNMIRSRERKTPSSANSSSRNQTVNAFGRWLGYRCDARSAIGMSSAVATTMKRLMPSTPTM